MTKKTAKRNKNMTFEQFKAKLAGNEYKTVVGARKGAAYIPEAEHQKALVLVSKHFGVGLDEPGESTRGPGKKVIKKKVTWKGAAKAAAKPVKAKATRRAAAKSEAPASVAPPAPARKPRVRRTPEPEATTQPSISSQEAALFQKITAICNAADVSQKVIAALDLANKISKNIDIDDALRETVETLKVSVRAIREQGVSAMSPSEPHQPESQPVSETLENPYGNGMRSADPQALAAAAAAAGVAPPATMHQ